MFSTFKEEIAFPKLDLLPLVYYASLVVYIHASSGLTQVEVVYVTMSMYENDKRVLRVYVILISTFVNKQAALDLFIIYFSKSCVIGFCVFF